MLKNWILTFNRNNLFILKYKQSKKLYYIDFVEISNKFPPVGTLYQDFRIDPL